MKLLIFLATTVLTLQSRAFSNSFYIEPGEGGKCELSLQAQRKLVSREEAMGISNQSDGGPRVSFTKYDSQNRALLLGFATCDGQKCPSMGPWASWGEVEAYPIKGNNDCSVKYVEIYPEHGQGEEVSTKLAAEYLKSFTGDLQSQCDYFNKSANGKSKIAIVDNSNLNKRALFNIVKSVTVDLRGICYLAD